MKIIIAAGGTGGHIIPAIAIAEALRKEGCEILYIGNKKGMEEELVQARGIPFFAIDVQKLYRSFTFSHVKFPFKLIKSIGLSMKAIREFKPDAFIGTGGFVSGPVGIASMLSGIPIFWQEQNCYPGMTTRFISKFAKRIFIAYDGATKYLPSHKCEITGNPINPSISMDSGKLDFSALGLDPTHKTILVLGGSQGSAALNSVIVESLDELKALQVNLIWQSGKRDYDKLQSLTGNTTGIHIFTFSNEMGKIYNSSDIAIARAGALTLAELESKKIPMILVPLPTAAGNHQYFNAIGQEEKKIAKVIEQSKLNKISLLKSIQEMIDQLDVYKLRFSETNSLDSVDMIAKRIIGILKTEHR